MRRLLTLALALSLFSTVMHAQRADSSTHDKTFLTRGDLLIAGLAAGATGLISLADTRIARESQGTRFHTTSLHNLSGNISKVNETSLTVGGLLVYGIGRLTDSRLVSDVALHATESVVLASLASQVIRGPLGRARPYVTHDSDQYDFSFGSGFKSGSAGFDRRAFPSIHTSSSMAVATVLTMETNRRHPSATKFVAPVLFTLGILPGLARIQLDQHWASDVAAGAFMGVFSGYKVVSYSHDHPQNAFDRVLLGALVAPDTRGGMRVGLSQDF